MRTVKHEKKKGAKLNEKQVQTRNEASNICTQVMIMNEAASTRFIEQTFLPKCGVFHQGLHYLSVQNVQRMLKVQERKDFKKLKTKTLKANTPKYFSRESFVSSFS